MSFRYKCALFSLVSTAAIYAWFAIDVFARLQARPLDLGGTLPRAIVALVTIQIVGQVLIAGTSSDKYDGPDRQEQRSEQRATAVGYYVLVCGIVAMVVGWQFGFTVPPAGHAALLTLTIAECTRRLIFLIACRRTD